MQRNVERRLNRHRNFNYSLPGYYYVTICAKNWIYWFGQVRNRIIVENQFGKLARELWQSIPSHYQNVVLNEFVIMPNHIHGIICVQNDVVGTGHCPVPAETQNMIRYGLLSKIVNGFKNLFTKTIRQQYHNHKFQWQRSFYDRVLRDQDELEHARWYIKNNPKKWSLEQDEFQI